MTRTSCPCLTHSLAKEWQTFVLFNIFSPGSEYNVDKSSIFIKNYPPLTLALFVHAENRELANLILWGQNYKSMLLDVGIDFFGFSLQGRHAMVITACTASIRQKKGQMIF